MGEMNQRRPGRPRLYNRERLTVYVDRRQVEAMRSNLYGDMSNIVDAALSFYARNKARLPELELALERCRVACSRCGSEFSRLHLDACPGCGSKTFRTAKKTTPEEEAETVAKQKLKATPSLKRAKRGAKRWRTRAVYVRSAAKQRAQRRSARGS